MVHKYPCYDLETAKELPGTKILALWHPDYGRLYLADTVVHAFNITGSRYESNIRHASGCTQNPGLSLIDLERVNVRVNPGAGKYLSKIMLTSLGFINFLENNTKPAVAALRAFVSANTSWEAFKISILCHGVSKLSFELKKRLWMESEMKTQLGLPPSDNQRLLLPPATLALIRRDNPMLKISAGT